MYFYDNKKHARPHIHAEYGDKVVSIAIDDGEILSGSLATSKMKLAQAWIEIHKEDLMANWKWPLQENLFSRLIHQGNI